MRPPAESASQDGKGALGAALVVEDNIMIALEVESLLQDVGFEACYLAGTVDAALLILEERAISFAIVDINLGDETSDAVARALQERALPFVFATGYDEEVALAKNFPGVPVLTKPMRDTQLYEALAQLGIM